MVRDEQILAFVVECSETLTARAGSPPIEEGARALADAVGRSTPKAFEPSWLPALDTIDLLDDGPLARSFTAVAPGLPWVTTTRATDAGTDFALARLDTVRDFGALTVGIMYVRPSKQYPLHQHPEQELYLTISGRARWRFGGNGDFRPLAAGSTLYNRPDDHHSAIAGPTPLVALYVLWPTAG